MLAQRQTTQSLVYWPITRVKTFSDKMTDNLSTQEQDAKRWQTHMFAIGHKRDKNAYKALYVYFAPKVKSFYMQQSSAAQAEEMTHEVFLRVWQKASSYQADKAQVSTWIFTIARNLKIDLLRKKQLIEISDENQLEAVSDLNLDESLEEERNQVKIGAMFKLLNEEQRNVLQKVYFEDKSHQSVSNELGLTLGEVKSRVRSALSILRSHLGGDK